MNSIHHTKPKLIWELDEQMVSDPELATNKIRQMVEQLETQQWDPADVFGIHMALEEAIMNAIKHGNADDRQKKIHLTAGCCTQSFFARVTDEGNGFDPNDVPDPTLEENLEKCSGRGVMLMQLYMDQVIYNDIGHSVEMFKTRSASPA